MTKRGLSFVQPCHFSASAQCEVKDTVFCQVCSLWEGKKKVQDTKRQPSLASGARTLIWKEDDTPNGERAEEVY